MFRRGGNTETGRRGEALAAAHLARAGYKILETNFRIAAGEIDIIARKRRLVVFVEVKARKGEGFGSPFDAVTPRKQLRIERAAKAWLAKNGVVDRPLRFDVIGVWLDRHPPRIDHLENAFQATSG